MFGVQLGKQVADVLRQAARLLGYETKHPERGGVEEEEEGVRKRERDKLLSMRGCERGVITQIFRVCLVSKSIPCLCNSLQG